MLSNVAAYITCYQDRESTHKCIEAIKAQSIEVMAIFIVDNSNPPLAISNNDSDFLVVNQYPNNIGIAQGISAALEWAIERKYDFLWTFDQDSIPTANCLENLLKTYTQLCQKDNYKIGIIAAAACDLRTGKAIESLVFTNDRFVGLKHNENIDYYECDSPITSGSLISLAAAQTISSPRAELFIDGIDFDYGLRLKKEGFHNLIVTKAVMYHQRGNPLQVKFFNKDRFVEQYPALRHYYICRNHTYLEIRFAQSYYQCTSFIRRIRYLLVSIFWILLYESENKQLKIWACLLGTYHGVIGKLGKCW
jgi:rhamnosyltransferase